MTEKPPESIWIENLNACYRHYCNCSRTNPDEDKDDHRIMDEYIRKDIVDKKEADAYTLGYQTAKKRFIRIQGQAMKKTVEDEENESL